MEETIAKIVLAGGLLGLIYLVIKKIPVLAQLPENQTVFSNQGITVQLRKVAEKMPFARSFSLNIINDFATLAYRLKKIVPTIA